MKAVVTEGSTVVFGGKTYESGDKFEIPDAEAEVFTSAGHIIDEATHKRLQREAKEAAKQAAEDAAAAETQEAKK